MDLSPLGIKIPNLEKSISKKNELFEIDGGGKIILSLFSTNEIQLSTVIENEVRHENFQLKNDTLSTSTCILFSISISIFFFFCFFYHLFIYS